MHRLTVALTYPLGMRSKIRRPKSISTAVTVTFSKSQICRQSQIDLSSAEKRESKAQKRLVRQRFLYLGLLPADVLRSRL